MDIPQTDRFRVEVDPGAMLRGFARHRRRFADAVASLDDDALAHPTRCSEWSVADVLRHCCDVDEWFGAGAAGGPTPFVDPSFDPITTPNELVDAQRAVPDAEVRDRFVASSHAAASEVDASGNDRWGASAASPARTTEALRILPGMLAEPIDADIEAWDAWDPSTITERLHGNRTKWHAPELRLLFKAKHRREKDEADFAAAAPLLDTRQRTWLREALTDLYGADQPWVARLS